MTDIDLKELRKLADAATAGPWRECGSARGGCDCGQVWSTYADMPVATAEKGDEEFGPIPEALTKANAAYIAAANPSALLSLLNRLEESEKRAVPEGWQAVPTEPVDEQIRAMLAVRWPATYREHLRHQLNGSRSAESTEREIEIARKQIAAYLATSPHISGSQEQEGKN